MSRRDIVHWINTWVWTYDPRDCATYPFDLFPRQEEFLRWLSEREANREGGLAEKSRDVGFTWLCACYAAHGWLFRRNFAVGFGSRKVDLVDRLGDPDSIMEKVRMLLRLLPGWMQPAGYNEAKHAGHCRIVNPETGSVIAGEGGDNIGRGGRKTIYFVDEAAFLERPLLVDAALSANTNVRIDVSTPNGVGNPFWQKRFSGVVPVFTFHYRDDPRKTPEWVEKKKASLDPVTWAQEYEIDYAASLEGVCIPAAWVRACVELPLPAVSTAYPLTAGFDIAEEGKSRSVIVPRRGPIVLEPEAWGPLNTTQSAWRAADYAERMGIEVIHFDAIGVGAGVRGAWSSSERKLKFIANPVKWGDPPTLTRWPSGKTSREMFANLRAELWWLLRHRCEKTYEYVTQGVQHPPDELLSLPNCPELIAQLSLPLYQTNSAGKIQLESKADMAKRGVASPDYADALAYSFAPRPAGMNFY